MPAPARQRRFVAVIAITILVVLLGSSILTLRDPSPRYGGRPLTEWVRILGTPAYEDPLVAERAAAREAVSQIGTNAIPFLLHWIAYEPRPSTVGARVAKIALGIPGGRHLQFLGRTKSRRSDELRARGAKQAFVVLGSRAAAAIPQLTLLVENSHDPPLQDRTVDALKAIGPGALPALMTLLTNKTDRIGKLYVVYAIGSFGTNAGPAIPLLLTLFDDPGWEAMTAASVLCELKTHPAILAPALSALKRPNVNNTLLIKTLGDLGDAARPALTFLLAALTDTDEMTRQYATNALLRVAPEVLTNSP